MAEGFGLAPAISEQAAVWPLSLRSCHSLALDLTPAATSLHWAMAQRLLETERRGNNCSVKRRASDSRQESHPEAFLQHCASSSRSDPTGKDGRAGSPGPTANCRRQWQLLAEAQPRDSGGGLPVSCVRCRDPSPLAAGPPALPPGMPPSLQYLWERLQAHFPVWEAGGAWR